jgi:antirestriction protein ArdC
MLTATEATSFDTFSLINATIVSMEKTCDCVPYQDVFTYNRWLAQGFQVKKGEHGIHIQTWKSIIKKDDNGESKVTGRFPKSSVVFCRCQVEKKS